MQDTFCISGNEKWEPELPLQILIFMIDYFRLLSARSSAAAYAAGALFAAAAASAYAALLACTTASGNRAAALLTATAALNRATASCRLVPLDRTASSVTTTGTLYGRHITPAIGPGSGRSYACVSGCGCGPYSIGITLV